MTLFKRIFLIVAIFNFTFPGLTQEKDALYYVPKRLHSYVDVHLLPEEGTFYTVQLSSADYYGYDHDVELLASFLFMRPIYFYRTGRTLRASVGIFSDLESASAYRDKLSCIYTKTNPFVVAYREGIRIGVNEIESGTLSENYESFKHTKKRLKKMIKGDYFEFQVGYYEQDGYESLERAKIDTLESLGYKLTIRIEDEYMTPGRRLLIKKKTTSLNEARAFVQQVRNETGIWIEIVKTYRLSPENPDLSFPNLWSDYVDYLHLYWECLNSKK